MGKERWQLSAQLQDGGKSGGGWDWMGLRDGDSRGKGYRPGAGEAGQLDGPVSRGGTTRGRSGKLLKRGWSRTCHDYGGGWDGMCGAAGWLAGTGGRDAAGTDLSGLPFGRMRWTGCSEGVRWREGGFGVIVFGCGKVAGTITRNEAGGRTGCAD